MNINDLIALERYKSKCNWIPTYGFVTNLANSVRAKNICEVGVAYGYHAEHILDNLPDVEYQGVDPYLAGYDPNDIFVADVAILFADDPQKAMDRLFSAVSYKLNAYNGRANLLRRSGDVAASRFVDGYFDLVYIDGDHTYAGVMADLNAWYSKVRVGGILCGDDFVLQSVRDAVMKFMTKRGKIVIGYSSPNALYPEKWSVII